MKQISTAKLGGRKKVEIDGKPYTVRKLGAGESLDLSQTQRRLEVLSKKEEAKTITEAETDELLNLGSKFIEAMAALYDGEGSKQLISSLSPDEILAMNKMIWEEADGETKTNS